MKKNIIVAVLAATIGLTGLTAHAQTYSLDFGKVEGHKVTLKYNGVEMRVRAFMNIVYVQNPSDAKQETMHIYVPEEYYHNQKKNGYTAETAPIFLYHKIAGYTPGVASQLDGGPRPAGRPATAPGGGSGSPQGPMGRSKNESVKIQNAELGFPSEVIDEYSHPNMPLAALSRGYVVACPAVRGRTDSRGKAPAALVDLKASVRYLKFNDKLMPGDANKIISDGTSAGGAMSALLGATGNHPDYEPYLKEIGAAPATDDIFATQAYCPITNLEHADMAYEWQFNTIHEAVEQGKPGADATKVPLTNEQIGQSNELKAMFPAYVNSLHLTNARGDELTLDEKGEGTFVGWLCHFLRESAQDQIKQGKDLSKYDWLEIKDGVVGSINFAKYVQYLGRKKAPVAFDALDLSSAENNEFGTATIDSQHFTAWGWKHSKQTGSTMAAENIIRMMNPMNYIVNPLAKTSPHWRICHGTKDSDTSMAIPVILGTYLMNNGYDVQIHLTWDQPHGGDYDTKEQFDWIDSLCK